MKQAIIVAAGMGTRLKDKTITMPKGFIEIGGIPMVEQSVQKCIAAGIEEIIIGTGHCAEWYERLAQKYPPITLVYSAEYETTGSMATLALCAEKAKNSGKVSVNSLDSLVVLESDLIYDSIGLSVLQNDSRPNVLLASGKTNSGDEVYLETDENHVLLANSKKKEELRSIYAELVGITKLDRITLDAMARYYGAHKTERPKMDYEAAMSAVSSAALAASSGGAAPSNFPIYVKKIEDYAWREVDDDNHLAMATNQVYPRIVENESRRALN